MPFASNTRIFNGTRHNIGDYPRTYRAVDADGAADARRFRLVIEPDQAYADPYARNGQDDQEVETIVSQWSPENAPQLRDFAMRLVDLLNRRLVDPVTRLRYMKSLRDPKPDRPAAEGVWFDYIGQVLRRSRPSLAAEDEVFGFEPAAYRRATVRGADLDDADVPAVRAAGSSRLTWEGHPIDVDFSVIPVGMTGAEFWKCAAAVLQAALRDLDGTNLEGATVHYTGERLELAVPPGSSISAQLAGPVAGYLGLDAGEVLTETSVVATLTGTSDIRDDATIRAASAAVLTVANISFSVDFSTIPAALTGSQLRPAAAHRIQAALRAQAQAEVASRPDLWPYLLADVWYDGSRFGPTVLSDVPGAIPGPFTGSFAPVLGLHQGSITDGIESPRAPEITGFDQAPFASAHPFLGGREPVDDDTYRRLLRAQGVAITSRGTIPDKNMRSWTLTAKTSAARRRVEP